MSVLAVVLTISSCEAPVGPGSSGPLVSGGQGFGGAVGSKQLKDASGTVLGIVVGASSSQVSILTPAKYFVSLAWDGSLTGQNALYASGLGGTGTLFGFSAQKGAPVIGFSEFINGTLYVASSADANGVALTDDNLRVVSTSSWYSPTWTNSVGTVAYDANGADTGTVPTDGQKFGGIGVANYWSTALGNSGQLTKSGLAFGGWNTQANGLGTTYLPGDRLSPQTSLVHLYSLWVSPSGYTVTYNANAATGGMVPVDSTVYPSGRSIHALDNTGGLVKAGSYFAGWNTLANGSGSSMTPLYSTTGISGNLTLYAHWVAGPVYAVTYEGNGATEGAPPIDPNTYDSGQSLSVRGNTGLLEKVGGYWFDGWNTAADGSGTTYRGALDSVNLTANVTLYARWTKDFYSTMYSYIPLRVGTRAEVGLPATINAPLNIVN